MATKKTTTKKAPAKKPVKKPTEAAKTAKPVKSAPALSKEERVRKTRRQLTVAPIVFSVLAVLLLIFFIFVNHQGTVGSFLTRAFTWAFGGAKWLLPVLLILGAIFWKEDFESDNILGKALISSGFFLSVDLLLYDIVTYWGGEKVLSGRRIWDGEAGAVGGGWIGNTLGKLLVDGIGNIAMPCVLILLALVFGVFLFGLTPGELFEILKERAAIRKAEREEARAYAAELDEDEEEEEYLPHHPAMVKKKPVREEKPQPVKEPKKKEKKTDIDLDDETLPPVTEDGFDDDFKEPDPETLPAGSQTKLKLKLYDPENPDAPLPDDRAPGEENTKFLATEEEIAREVDAILGREDELPGSESEHIGDETAPAEQQPYRLPPITLLAADTSRHATSHPEDRANADKLVETLRSFKVETHVGEISHGPTVTQYELIPEKGVRVRAIANLADDIALNLAAKGVRIEAPIPGKAAVGVEVPNAERETVLLRTMIDQPSFRDGKQTLTAAVGLNVAGEPIYMDLAKMPHILIAGTTGSGKSVCMNCLILSLLYKYTPDEVKMIMIDPKKVEFNVYNGLPHLIIPVVSHAKKAAGALAWAVTEMEHRYELIEDVGVRDIKGYNSVTKNDPDREYMPLLVIFIDELADLMMTAPAEVEESICRIAQKGRAAGLHLVIGTQRPSVDVITGLIKANVPSRIAFTVSSQVDSRTIIDIGGAEKLTGKGDMLFAPIGEVKPFRLQGAFVSDNEVEAVTNFIKDNCGDTVYNDDVMKDIEKEAELCGVKKGKGGGAVNMDAGDDEADPMLEAAIEVALETGKISTSLIQRRLSLGYGRAAKLIDKMEQMGVVSAPDGQKPRSVLISQAEWAEMKMHEEA